MSSAPLCVLKSIAAPLWMSALNRIGPVTVSSFARSNFPFPSAGTELTVIPPLTVEIDASPLVPLNVTVVQRLDEHLHSLRAAAHEYVVALGQRCAERNRVAVPAGYVHTANQVGYPY